MAVQPRGEQCDVSGFNATGAGPAHRALLGQEEKESVDFGAAYGRTMAARPSAPVVVGTPATTVMVVIMLQAMPCVVLVIGELVKKEQASMEEVFNYCHNASHTQKDELTDFNVSCAQFYFLRGSLTAHDGRVQLADAESKRAREETNKLRDELRALRGDKGYGDCSRRYP